jgi:hypothetical protein
MGCIGSKGQGTARAPPAAAASAVAAVAAVPEQLGVTQIHAVSNCQPPQQVSAADSTDALQYGAAVGVPVPVARRVQARSTNFPSSGSVTQKDMEPNLTDTMEGVAMAESELLAANALETGLGEALDTLVSRGVSRRASVAMGLGIKEITWDAELVDASPLEGLARFLTANRFRMIDLFKMLNKGNNNMLNFDEFGQGMLQLGIPLSGDREARLHELFDQIDVDGDQKLSYFEFSSIRNHGGFKSQGSSPSKPASRRSTAKSPRSPSAQDGAAATGMASPRTPGNAGTDEDDNRGDSSRETSPVSGKTKKKKKKKKAMTPAQQQHADRQKFLDSVKKEKKKAAVRRPSQDVGRQLGMHMDSARQANLTPAGAKRIHPFLDPNGTGSKIKLDLSSISRADDAEEVTEV